MSAKHDISAGLNEIWSRLHSRWSGPPTDAFYEQYIRRMTEMIEGFEDSCDALGTGAAELSKKLELIEHDIE
ncbi:MAG: hypothetical protein LUG86_01365 [Oscillospiraceae bacterium]|nr:hypothetical protein [Oscillospiraceae bacterium]